MSCSDEPVFPAVDENDKAALMRMRSLVIGRLVAIEEALNEKHGTNLATI